MDRPAIPAEIRRSVLVEAGHRCAIPTCRYPDVDVHHIIPWETCKRHDFDNLIALCPNCHRRADAEEIDRKALRLYKARLSAAVKFIEGESAGAHSRISEAVIGNPGYEFDFEVPVFDDPALECVESEIRAWAVRLLHQHRARHLLDRAEEPGLMYAKNTTSAAYEVVRNDDAVVSVRYTVNRYVCGAAHGGSETCTFNYWKDPMFRVGFLNLLDGENALRALASKCRDALLKDPNMDSEWVRRGTEPRVESFVRFAFSEFGIVFTFDEYEVACYAAGAQLVELSRTELEGIVRPFFMRAVGYV